jgi:hypothetical protein
MILTARIEDGEDRVVHGGELPGGDENLLDSFELAAGTQAAALGVPSAFAQGAVMYHYTNPEAYSSMKTGRTYREKGLLPIRRFITLNRRVDLPEKAFEGNIQGLLEPEPESWTNNPEFPEVFRYLAHDLCKRDELMLLSVELLPTDDAYVVDRAHFERFLYRGVYQKAGNPLPPDYTEDKALRLYWESRVPVNEYKGGYSLPQFSVWSPIDFDRLKVEWVKDTHKFWDGVLDKTDSGEWSNMEIQLGLKKEP